MTLDKLLNNVKKRVYNGYRDYNNFDDKYVNKIISKSYDYVKTSEDFNKINECIVDIMHLHSYYKPNVK